MIVPFRVRRLATYITFLRKNRAFRVVWLGEIVSFAGDWFNTLAIYAVLQHMGASALAITSIWAVKTLPIFVISPLAGILADRFDRKNITVWSNIVRAILVLVLVWFAKEESFLGIYVSLIVLMLMSGIFIPARQALTPMIVRKEDLVTANALSAATWSSMLALGAATGGLVTEAFGPYVALLIDAATFLLAAFFLSLLPRKDIRSAEEISPDSTSNGPTTLWQTLRGSGYLTCLVQLKAWMGLVNGAVSMFPVLVAMVYGSAKASLAVGALYAVRGLGSFIGSLLPRNFFGHSEKAMQRAILGAYVVIGVGYLLLAYSKSVTMASFAVFFAAIGTATVWVFSGTLLQLAAPSAVHGRLFSMEFALLTLTFAISSIFSGASIDYLEWTPAETLRLYGKLAFVVAILWGSALLFRQSRARRTKARECAEAHFVPGALDRAASRWWWDRRR